MPRLEWSVGTMEALAFSSLLLLYSSSPSPHPYLEGYHASTQPIFSTFLRQKINEASLFLFRLAKRHVIIIASTKKLKVKIRGQFYFLAS